LSGPLLDRVDVDLTVKRVELDKLTSLEQEESSAVVRGRVLAARQRQWRRLAEHPRVGSNGEMGVAEIRAFCELGEQASSLLLNAVERLGLSARAYHRVLRLSRTIADLRADERIEAIHVAEAIQYQPRGWRQ
jgi:magnesium chelatase family protein